MPVYSHSRISCFEQCPLKFKFAYIDKLEPEIKDTIEAFLGCRVHEALEKLYADLKFQKLLSEDELIDFYNNIWDDEWHDEIGFVREYSAENYKQMGENYLRQYYKKNYPFDQSKTVGLETNFQVPIDTNKEINFHIKIDRLSIDKEGVYEIHDYKTGNSLPIDDDFENDRQLTLYAYGVKNLYPDASSVRLVWHYLAFDKEIVKEKEENEIEKARLQALEKIKEIENCYEFPARESKLCSWCGFQRNCPRFKHLYENDKSRMEGGKLVERYYELSEEIRIKQKELEKIKEDLANYAEEQGVENVYGETVRAFVRKYPSTKFPNRNDPRREEFVECVKQSDFWDRVSTVDHYELTKLLNNGVIKAPELEKFITRGYNSRVYIKKR